MRELYIMYVGKMRQMILFLPELELGGHRPQIYGIVRFSLLSFPHRLLVFLAYIPSKQKVMFVAKPFEL